MVFVFFSDRNIGLSNNFSDKVLKGFIHGGFYIYINLGILSLCTEL